MGGCTNCGKGCPELKSQENNPCCDKFLPNELEVILAEFFSCAEGQLLDLTQDVYEAELLGQPQREEAAVDFINDYMYLYAYLNVIYWQMQYDAANNPPCYVNYGPEYYYDKYKLECIVKYFRCRNVDIKTLLASFNLYPFGVFTDGIGRMAIEDPNPPVDDCTDNDAVFTVS